MLLCGPPTMPIAMLPFPLRDVSSLGSSTRMGIGEFARTTPHVACAPTSMVLAPDIKPAKYVWTRSSTLTWTKAFESAVGSLHIAGAPFPVVQLVSPATLVGNEKATS